MYKLVLIRHGESTWNLENRFTGWTDVDLTPTGVSQAMSAGKLLKAEGYEFDVAYTSVLKRAIETLWFCLNEMERTWLPVQKTWRLNERHYGALQGLDKAETAAKYGDQQVLVWRRSYDTPPNPLDPKDPRASFDDPQRADRASAVLALVGVINVPIIHYSVDWWTTLHQPASVTKLDKPSIALEMLYPLFLMMIGFQLYFGWAISRRLRGEILRRERNAKWLKESR